MNNPTSGKQAHLQSQTNKTIINFGGNISFTPQHFYQPQNEAQVLDILNRHALSKIRVVASLHSWNDGIASEDVAVDLSKFNRVEIVTTEGGEVIVTAGGGCVIKKLLKTIHNQTNHTLPTIGAITEQTIAGAISTATHGSGKFSLSHYIEVLRVAAYDPTTGKAKIYQWQEGDELLGARCALGCMGIVLSVTLRCIPQYYVAETVRSYPTLAEVLAQEKEFPWQEFILVPYLWKFFAYQRRNHGNPPRTLREKLGTQFYRFYNLVGVDIFFHLVVKALICRGIPPRIIPWFYRYLSPSFVVEVNRIIDRGDKALTREHQLFKHLEMEVFIPARNIFPAMAFVRQVIDWFAGIIKDLPESLTSELRDTTMLETLRLSHGIYTHHYPLFLRRVLSDDTLISMTSNADEPYYTVSFFTYQKDETKFCQLADFLARSLTQLYQAKLHWGKYFPLTNGEIEHLYPQLDTFRHLCKQVDPQEVFRNNYITRVIG